MLGMYWLRLYYVFGEKHVQLRLQGIHNKICFREGEKRVFSSNKYELTALSYRPNERFFDFLLIQIFLSISAAFF